MKPMNIHMNLCEFIQFNSKISHVPYTFLSFFVSLSIQYPRHSSAEDFLINRCYYYIMISYFIFSMTISSRNKQFTFFFNFTLRKGFQLFICANSGTFC